MVPNQIQLSLKKTESNLEDFKSSFFQKLMLKIFNWNIELNRMIKYILKIQYTHKIYCTNFNFIVSVKG